VHEECTLDAQVNEKNGIVCAGNWVLGRVKIIDNWPGEGELADILEETSGLGGSPFTILMDFARMRVRFPSYAFGCIGDDVQMTR